MSPQFPPKVAQRSSPHVLRSSRIAAAALGGVSLLAMVTGANAQAIPPVLNVCAGPSVSLPVLTPVTSAVDTSVIAGIVNPLLSGLTGNINTNLTGVLSGAPLSVSVLDANGNLISAPSTACSLALPNVNGITVGGGRIDGLGGTGAVAAAGDPTSIAIGNGSLTALGNVGATALGTAAQVTGSAGTAIGAGAITTAAGGVALGNGSLANRTNAATELFSGSGLRSTLGTVSFGSAGNERQIINVAGGTLDTDAVNVRQLRTVGTNLATSLGSGAGFNPATGAFTAPSYLIGGNTYRDVGSALAAIQPGAVVASLVQQVAPGAPITVGAGTDGTVVNLRGTAGDRALTGVAAGTLGVGSTDAVNGSQLLATRQAVSTNLSFLGGGGSFNPLTGTTVAPTFTVGGVSFGDVASAFASIQVGNNVVIPPSLVQQATPTSTVTVAAATGGTVVDFTGTSGTRTLAGVSAGALSATSTEAVNGSQLFATNTRIDTTNTRIDVTNQRVDFLAVNTVQYDIDPATGLKGNTVTLAGGDPNAPVLLRNVSAGIADTDGANVGQVRASQQASMNYTDLRSSQVLQLSKNYTDQQINNALSGMNDQFSRLNADVREVRREARQAASVGLAAASLRYDDRPGKISMAAGGASWRGEAGAAFGVGYTTPDGLARFNAAASTSGSNWGVSGGLSLTLN